MMQAVERWYPKTFKNLRFRQNHLKNQPGINLKNRRKTGLEFSKPQVSEVQDYSHSQHSTKHEYVIKMTA